MPLENYGFKRLFNINTKEDYPKEFKRMNKELRECLRKILYALLKKEDTRDAILQAKSLFINMHYLLNEFRPIQAKREIAVRLRNQIELNEGTLKKINDIIKEAKKKLDV